VRELMLFLFSHYSVIRCIPSSNNNHVRLGRPRVRTKRGAIAAGAPAAVRNVRENIAAQCSMRRTLGTWCPIVRFAGQCGGEVGSGLTIATSAIRCKKLGRD